MNDRLSQDHVSQNDVTTKNGRFIRDRHSRLVEQNRRLERDRQRSRFATLLIFGLAAILSITPVSNAVKKVLRGGKSTTSAVTASSSEDPARIAVEVLTANPVKADKVTGTTRSSSSLDADPDGNTSDTSQTKDIVNSKKKQDETDSASGTEDPGSPQEGTPEDTPTADTDVGSDADRTANNYLMLHTAMGPMLYYNQDDPLWRDYLWGGTDTFHEYGCGPTVCAMIANSFGNSPDQITPIVMAEWAVNDHDFARGSGSYNTLIQNSLTAFGLKVVSRQNVISESMIREELHAGHILVCLMGPGEFTDSGHFIILTALNDDGTITVADPVSLERTKTNYDPALIVSQLESGRSNGAPIWTVYR